MKSDQVPNIDIHKEIRKGTERTDFTHLNEKWAIGTTKHRSATVPAKGGMVTTGLNIVAPASEYKEFRNPTDIISFNPPAAKRPFQKAVDKILTDPGYKNNIESKTGWADKMQLSPVGLTVNNRSSVTHNIISHQDNKMSGIVDFGTLSTKINNRKKGITEYADLSRVTALRSNESHGEAFGKNTNIFRRKTGIFTHMYDAAGRHGYLNMPFGE